MHNNAQKFNCLAFMTDTQNHKRNLQMNNIYINIMYNNCEIECIYSFGFVQINLLTASDHVANNLKIYDFWYTCWVISHQRINHHKLTETKLEASLFSSVIDSETWNRQTSRFLLIPNTEKYACNFSK